MVAHFAINDEELHCDHVDPFFMTTAFTRILKNGVIIMLYCLFPEKIGNFTIQIQLESTKLEYNTPNEPPLDKTNKVSVRPAKTQISLGICPGWSESSLCAQWVAKGPSFLHADSEDFDQTGWMPRLTWVSAGRTVTLLVLSWGGSNQEFTYLELCWHHLFFTSQTHLF